MACATALPPGETERTLNADMSLAVRSEPHAGHSAVGVAARTSSSNRWSHSRQANS
jgi:hypothetical protein